MKKVRILALVHEHLVPPEDTTGIDVLEAEWKMEYDVIETLRERGHEVRVLGVHDDLAGIRPRLDIETGEEEPWELKDLRKTCATYHDEHVPESSVEILGHSVRGITYRHYAHRAPLAFRAIMTLPQPSAFSAILRGGDSECPCCRRRFADAG